VLHAPLRSGPPDRRSVEQSPVASAARGRGRFHSVGGMSTFYTVGHSTRTVTELVDLVRGAGANFIVDVRSMPRSRTNPQFNADTLPNALAAHQIGYSRATRLGGLRDRRKGQAASRNTFWKNTSFRNYADYTATPDFRKGMAELRDLGRVHACAIMCAEAVWWRCHRRRDRPKHGGANLGGWKGGGGNGG
jgi:uncharacterized protein (DUF488 family)